MTILASILILAQVGPFTAPNAGSGPRIPPPAIEGREKKRQPAPAAIMPKPVTSRSRACEDAMASDPAAAQEIGEEWVASAKGDEVAQAQVCLGMAKSRRGDWEGAESAFIAARDAASDDPLGRVRYGSMAGNAALAGNAAGRALTTFAQAATDAKPLDDKRLSGEIALDKARSLVALKRAIEARMAFDEALELIPQSSDAWLLSATLFRKVGKLDLAQSQIERAASINPGDPAVGLEAGVIAMLAGREASARKSWQSVLTMAPQSGEAVTAKDYLAQIGPGTAAPPPAR